MSNTSNIVNMINTSNMSNPSNTMFVSNKSNIRHAILALEAVNKLHAKV